MVSLIAGAGPCTERATYALAVGVVERLQLHNVGVAHDPHDLQFAVLEALVLQDPLDRGILVGRRQLRLEDDAERPVADDLTLRVLYLPGLAGDAILYLLADHFCNRSSAYYVCPARPPLGIAGAVSPPIRRVLNAAGLFDAMVELFKPRPCYRCGQPRGNGGGCEEG